MKIAAGQWTCEKSCNKQKSSGIAIQVPLRVSSGSSTEHRLLGSQAVLGWEWLLLPAKPVLEKFHSRGESSRAQMQFLSTFCIHYLMALDCCHYFRSSVSLRIMFEHQAQATESWSFHIPLFSFRSCRNLHWFLETDILCLTPPQWLAWIENNPCAAYCWNRVSVGSAQATISSAFPRFSIWF